MSTKDPKDSPPRPSAGRPSPGQGPNPTRNVRSQMGDPPLPPPGVGELKPSETPRSDWSRPNDPAIQQPADQTPDSGAASVQDVREGARQMVDQLSQSGAEVRESAQDFAQRADLWLRQQTDDRPWAMVIGAMTAGYVVGGGLPRVAVRFLARVGLPIAAAIGVARALAWEDEQIRQHEPNEPMTR